MKSETPRATREDVTRFLLSHDGNPSSEFIYRVQTDPDSRRLYTETLTRALSDKNYGDNFFSLTGKCLDLNFALAEAWAEQIAAELFGAPPTLQ